MNNALLIMGGACGMLVAVGHGFIGHKKVLQPLTGPSPAMLRLNYAVFQMTAIYWFAGGAALVLAPFTLDPAMRLAVAVMVAFVYAVGALGNILLTRGRHFGGYALALAAVLSLLGG
ncbi:hypothetical protein [Ascidiaceihabitans sp.]